MFKTLNDTNKLKFSFQAFTVISMFIVWAFLIIFNVHPTNVYTGQCYFYTVHGVFCPGCGGTRAFEHLLYGHFLQSFLYHPIVVTVVFFLMFSTISYILYFITRGKVLYYELTMKHFIIIDLIFVANFAVKNLLVLYFNYYIF